MARENGSAHIQRQLFLQSTVPDEDPLTLSGPAYFDKRLSFFSPFQI